MLIGKLFSALCDPLAIIMLLLLIGLGWRRMRKTCLVIACVLILLFGLSPLSNTLLRELCQRYDPVRIVDPEVREIVTLASGGFNEHESYPINARMTPNSLARLMEAARLHRNLPESRIWVSAPGVYTNFETGKILGDLEILFQLPESTLHSLSGARTTSEEAQLAIGKIDPKTSFYLVTSDYHLRRAMKTLERADFSPLPAPASVDREPSSRFFL